VTSPAAFVMPSGNAVQSRGGSFTPVLLASLAFHLVVFVGIPVFTRMLYHAERYERPKTFTLVNMPKIAPQAMQQAARQKPKGTTPVPSKSRAKSATKKEDKPQDKNDDLNELLDAIPTKASDLSVAGKFKANWYTQNMQSRIEENFIPPMGLTDRKDVSVVVTFTVFEGGNISAITVVQSSGIPTLDNCAVKAVEASAPFGKLPLTFSDNRIDPTVTLYYVKK